MPNHQDVVIDKKQTTIHVVKFDLPQKPIWQQEMVQIESSGKKNQQHNSKKTEGPPKL
jgi:hypothetical protein